MPAFKRSGIPDQVRDDDGIRKSTGIPAFAGMTVRDALGR